MKKTISILTPVLLLALMVTGWAQTKGQTNAEGFYGRKVMRLIVGYGAGGGFDAYARIMAPYVKKYTGATVIVQNMPGGGGSVAINHLYNTAKPDGLAIGIAPARMALSQLMGERYVKFDFAKFNFLGRVGTDTGVLLVGARSDFAKMSPPQVIKGMKTARKLKFAAQTKDDIPTISFGLISHALGFKPKMVLGYKGTAECAASVIRGECDAFVASGSSAARYRRGGDVIAKFVIATERESEVPDVPAVTELVTLSQEGKWCLDKAVSLYRPLRLLIAPPGVPKERIKFLVDGFYKALHDPELVARANKMKRPIAYATPKEVAADINEIVGMDEASKKKIKYIILEEFY